jgi:hypothetical protein
MSDINTYAKENDGWFECDHYKDHSCFPCFYFNKHEMDQIQRLEENRRKSDDAFDAEHSDDNETDKLTTKTITDISMDIQKELFHIASKNAHYQGNYAEFINVLISVMDEKIENLTI